jgi:uncharacterized protein (TIGR00369 family)
VIEPWREPVRGGHPDPSHGGLPGAEALAAMLAGRAPAPPMTRLLGVRLTEIGEGTATFELPITGWLRGADGRIGIGPLVMPADGAMACAIIAGLPAYTAIATTELTLRQLRPVPDAGTLLARASVIEPGPPLSLADVAVTTQDGTLIAHGSSLCLQSEIPAAAMSGTNAASGTAETHDGPDPWQRDPPDPGASRPPLTQLTGVQVTGAGDRQATAEMPATPWLCAPPPGRLQGGAVALLADAAMSAAAATVTPVPARVSPVEIKINYVRPLVSDGRLAHARASVVNGGRRIVVTAAEVRDADERLVAFVSGSFAAF